MYNSFLFILSTFKFATCMLFAHIHTLTHRFVRRELFAREWARRMWLLIRFARSILVQEYRIWNVCFVSEQHKMYIFIEPLVLFRFSHTALDDCRLCNPLQSEWRLLLLFLLQAKKQPQTFIHIQKRVRVWQIYKPQLHSLRTYELSTFIIVSTRYTMAKIN